MGRAVLTSSPAGLNRQFSNKFRSKFERRRIPKIVLNFERTEYRRAGRRYSKLSILISKELVGERGSWCSFDCWNCTDSISWMDKVARSRRWVTFGGTIPRPDSHNWTNFAEEQASSKRPPSTHGSLHLGTNFEPLFLRVPRINRLPRVASRVELWRQFVGEEEVGAKETGKRKRREGEWDV